MKEIFEMYEKHTMEMEFNKIFKSKDPFSEVFHDRIAKKLLICPTDGYDLTEEQFESLLKASKAIGDNEIYISEIECLNCFENNNIDGKYQCKHWITKNTTSYEEYKKLQLVGEYAIYSIKGDWGIIISHEEHALVGGPNEFISHFKVNYGDWKNDIRRFKEVWIYNKEEYNCDVGWIQGLLNHINEYNN